MKTSRWREAQRLASLFLTISLVSACVASLSGDEFRRLHVWFTCDECVNRERQNVAAIGAKAVPMLDSALIGPSRGREALMRAKFGDSYRFAGSPGPDSGAYINPRVANYVATYQKRAAVSLGDIGGDEAERALDRAIRDSAVRGYRPDVVRTIKLVRTNLGAVTFPGRVIPSLLSFGDIVSVIAPPGQHFTAQDRAAIEDSPFPPDQIPFVLVGDTLRFFAVANAGPHVIVVSRSGGALGTGAVPATGATPPGGVAPPAGTMRAVGTARVRGTIAPVTITSLLDSTDRATLSCAPPDLNCAVLNALPLLGARLSPSSPVTTFLALSRLPPRHDTLDFFKVEPLVNLPLTALLDWHGPANLDLSWRRCSPFVPVGPTTGATLASVESTTVVVPARECWILQVSMGPGGTGPALARLRIRSP